MLVIRKASGQGLGHLLTPYDEPPLDRLVRTERIGVPLWQEDLWKEVIRAADTDTPDPTGSTLLPPTNRRLRRSGFSAGSRVTMSVTQREKRCQSRIKPQSFCRSALRQDLACPFNNETEVHCAKYFQMTFVTPRFLEFLRSTDSSDPPAGKTHNQ